MLGLYYKLPKKKKVADRALVGYLISCNSNIYTRIQIHMTVKQIFKEKDINDILSSRIRKVNSIQNRTSNPPNASRNVAMDASTEAATILW